MKNNFKTMCQELEESIIQAYESGVSLEDAERLAAKFLHGQLMVSEQLKSSALDSRMRKSGLKALRASLYLAEVQKTDKKPTESMLTSLLDSNEIIQGEQQALDSADTEEESLERYYNIFANAHVYFRGVAKGRFE